MGYEPIEESYDETENVYIIEIEEPGKDPSSSEKSESDSSDSD